MTARAVVSPAALAGRCSRLHLTAPPGFDGTPDGLVGDDVPASVIPGLSAVCAPDVAVVVQSSLGRVVAAAGIRDGVGGSLLRAGGSDVEVSAWAPVALDSELARLVPRLPARARPTLHLPLSSLAGHAALADVLGTLHATVVRPPRVVGVVVWLATTAGWLWIVPAESIDAVRWVSVAPARPDDLGAAVAPHVATALA